MQVQKPQVPLSAWFSENRVYTEGEVKELPALGLDTLLLFICVSDGPT